ncbi:nucleotidyltransferase domain-containing protein [Pelosinus propionicus]|nr:nucleotidyltransferase domain-containing protein [Pelosinus propionicus]
MDIQKIKEKINSTEYDFLRKNRNLGDRMILLTTGGSYAYGTHVETSDTDIRGIAAERKEELLGLSNFEQFEDRITDTVIYGLRKTVNLALAGNPNILEMLGTREDHLLILTDEGKCLRDHADLFLSKRVIQSFGNYATAQLRRLQNALARDSYPQAVKEQHMLNSIQGQMHHFKQKYHQFMNEEINLYIDKSNKEDYEAEIFMDINLKHYPLRDFKSIYSEMSNVVKDYSQLNHRNKKKDALKLNKHAMHLIRLLITGSEILQGKGIHTYRAAERDYLLEIRSGKFTYEEIFAAVDKLEAEFKYAAQNTVLPDEPNHKAAEELLICIYEKML